MAVLSKVAVFWDIENCAIPATVHGGAAVSYIESVAREYGICSPFRAYSSVIDGISYQKKSDLITAGVSLIPTHVKMADHVLITDMLEWAFENPTSSTIVLVTGDRDFSYTISLLRRRGIRVVLIAPKAAAHSPLAAQAARVVEWNPASMMPKIDSKRRVPLSAQATPPHPNIEDDEPTAPAPSLPASCATAGNPVDTTHEHESAPPTEPAAKASPGPSQLGLTLNPTIPPFVPKFAAIPAAPNAQQGGWVVSVETNGPDVDVITADCSDEQAVDSVDPAMVPLPSSPITETPSLPPSPSPETVMLPLSLPETVQPPLPSPESGKHPLPLSETVKPSLPSPEPSPAAAKSPTLPPGLEQHIQSRITPPSSHSTSESELEEVDVEDKLAPVEAKPEVWLRPVQNQFVPGDDLVLSSNLQSRM
ncbi:hypothetical protein AURDEDRAFT_181512 [Auricularia subglabra TFB-10046 SS5]|nr:hypothetical protein AURDEDRAFT_181512 [Auricularia subglabra TFB-10046 SS5]